MRPRSRNEPDPEESPSKGTRLSRGLTQMFKKSVASALAVMDKLRAVSTRCWSSSQVLQLYHGGRGRDRDGPPMSLWTSSAEPSTICGTIRTLSGSWRLSRVSSRTW